MAVRHDLRPRGSADELAHLVGRQRLARTGEERIDLHSLGAGNMALPRIAWAAVPARVFLLPPDIEDRQGGVGESRSELVPRRKRAWVRLERGLTHRLQLDRARLELSLPSCDPA